MYMPYSNNPHLPRVRMEAVRLVRAGWSTVKVARHFGYAQGTVVKWVARSKDLPANARIIPTESSRPHHHPNELSLETVLAILRYREKTKRCAEVIHHLMVKDGYEISLSSVKRTLKRNGLTKYSPWKKWHQYPERPLPETPGILVQLDTIHDGPHTDRLYVYTLLDVCSRWAYADVSPRINTHKSLKFVEGASRRAPFIFQTLQSDHGSEFSKWFTKRVGERGMSHRHSRVRRPTDNGHLERFNRTIQEECLKYVPRNVISYQKAIRDYLHFYNTERPHMGLNMKTPAEMLKTIPSY
jgi:transposase InsO family protein